MLRLNGVGPGLEPSLAVVAHGIDTRGQLLEQAALPYPLILFAIACLSVSQMRLVPHDR